MAGLVAVATVRQWEGCDLAGAKVDAAEQVVELDWQADVAPPAPVEPRPSPAGLAVDPACFVYHALPEEGRVARARWSKTDGLADEVHDVLAPPPDDDAPAPGAFHPVGLPASAVRAVALAVDDESRLFVADGADGAVAVYDLADRRLLQRVRLPGRALDLAFGGGVVTALCADPDQPLWRVAARRDPVALEVEGAEGVVRLAAAADGALFGLTVGGAVLALAPERRVLGTVADGTDIEVAGDGSVVVADSTGHQFACFSAGPGADHRLRPLVGRDYDGRGIVRLPDGSIGFWTTAGRLRRAVAASLKFPLSGTVEAGPLDGRTYHESWGRVLVDACVPAGASVWVATATADLPDDEPVYDRPRPLRCRETGSEVPWAQTGADDTFDTLEGQVDALAGRYLWVRLELRGTGRNTPKVRAVRVEHPGHDLLRRLPRTYSRDPVAASFLYRYLAVAAGLLTDAQRRADERDVLLDPAAAPGPVLPWLAGLIGLALDARWSESARRTLIAEATCLYRKRGTKGGLERLLEIYLGRACRIVELFQVRGQGGGTLGRSGVGDSAAWSSAVVGAGLRVGGAAGAATAQPLEGTAQDSFSRTAHRFSVVIPARLDGGQERAVRDLLDVWRPAHTAYELCTVGAGMRVGRGLYLELTSVVGPGSGFEQARVGDTALGHDGVLGPPDSRGALHAGAARVGTAVAT